jgi:hypothetical protein
LAQLQFAPQLQAGPQAQVAATVFWQPQVQLEPAQVVQVQRASLVLFIVDLLFQWGGLW